MPVAAPTPVPQPVQMAPGAAANAPSATAGTQDQPLVRMKGDLFSVNIPSNTITVKDDRTGNKELFKLDSKVKITKSMKVKDMAIGNKIVVSYKKDKNQNKIACLIQVINTPTTTPTKKGK
jgi:hypothetical protein